MSEFGKTLIVDISLSADDAPNKKYKYIQSAVAALTPPIGNGGIIIVEKGIYEIDGTNDFGENKLTITVPSNVSIIGRGNAVIEVKSTDTGGVSAFFAEDEENITISGFKIVIEDTAPSAEHTYDRHLIYMKNVKNSVIEKLYVTDESSLGVKVGFAAICFNGTSTGECTGNIIQQNVIESFGQIFNHELDFPSKSYNFGYGIFLTTNCNGNTIKNNIILNNNTGMYITEGSCDNVVSNNINKGNGRFAWDSTEEKITSPGPNFLISRQSNNNVIIGNISSEGISSHGLYIAGSEGCAVCGNINSNNFDAGIKIRYDLQKDENGIKIGSNPVQYHTFVGNICNNNGYVNPDHNYEGLVRGGNGIHLQAHSQYNTVLGNICAENDSSGIRVYEDLLTILPEYWHDDIKQAQNNVVVGNYTGNELTENSEFNDYPHNLP